MMGPVASRTFQVEATVPTSPERAIDFLMQLDQHRGLHAYLESADVTGSGTDAEGEWTDWAIVERPKLGPFRYRIRFPARMIRTAPTTMIGRVRAAPGCTLETRTTAEGTDASARVTETVLVTAPWLLVGYMARHARLAHEKTYGLLPAELAR